jgi:hypothetical protein
MSALTLSLNPGHPRAHPRCDVAVPEGYVTKKYNYKISAKSTLTSKSVKDNIERGLITFSSIKYKKWPKDESRNDVITVSYQYDSDSECDWWPNTRKKVFILSKRQDGSLLVINAY